MFYDPLLPLLSLSILPCCLNYPIIELLALSATIVFFYDFQAMTIPLFLSLPLP
jgi:hypothetical protein